MSKIRVSAKTKEEAITKALIQLSTTSDRLIYDVLVEGKAGLFGIGAKPWIIEASVKEEAVQSDLDDLEKEIQNIAKGNNVPKANVKNTEAKTHTTVEVKNDVKKEIVSKPKRSTTSEDGHQEKKEHSDDHRKFDGKKKNVSKKYPKDGYEIVDAPVDELKEERKQHVVKPISEEEAAAAANEVERFITSVLKGMNMDVHLSTSFDHETNELLVNMEGPDMGILIGKRGQTLDSLQYLSSLVVNKNHKEDYIRVKLDTEDYRSRRETTLKNLARNIAYRVKRSKKAVSLEPMNPYERRIIHSALQNDRFVTTKSEGEEPFRHVIIYMKKNPSRDRKRDGFHNRDHRSDKFNSSKNNSTENSVLAENQIEA